MALEHTCEGLVELASHLLETGHDYALLGKFSTDDLESKFGELRQGSVGTYFITVQNSLEKFKIQRTRLLLHLKVDMKEPTDNHECLKCNDQLNGSYCNLRKELDILEEKLTDNVKSTLFYIAGYLSL